MLALDEEHHGVLALARWAEMFTKWCALNYRANGHWLVIHGPVGCGKSHAAKRIARYIRDNAVDLHMIQSGGQGVPTVYSRDWSKLVSINDDVAFDAATEDIADATLVVLDDIGAEVDRYKDGQPAARLRRVLEACRNKWLVLTTNVSRNDWATVFDARIESRLRAARHCNCAAIQDYRPHLAAKVKGTT